MGLERRHALRLARWVLALAGPLSAAACAMQDGQPWGELTVSVRGQWQVAADRTLPDGRFRTASEYLWRIDEASVHWLGADAVVAKGGAPSAFDPANPPAGYSFCHGGHCHADDGRLVDYADIEIELLGAGAAASTVVLPLDATSTLVPGAGPAQQSGSRDLPLGEVRTLRLRSSGLRVRARVWDARPGSPRLPPEGVEVDLDLPPLQVAAQVAIATGLHAPPHIRAALEWVLPVDWLDGLEAGPLVQHGRVSVGPTHPLATALHEAAVGASHLHAAYSRKE